MFKSKDNEKDDNAEYNKSQGEEEIKTSCIFCKYKPNYADAIPSFRKAADQYHGLRDWDQEIYCRIRLALCFKETNSLWEEGNEYQKIAFVQLNQQSKKEEALNNIQLAHQCFYNAHEYDSSIKCLIKMSFEYRNRSESDYAEKTLKVAYDIILKIYHVISLSNNDDVTYVFELMDAYFELLVQNNNANKMISVAETFITLLKEDSKNKKQISHVYGIILCSYLINSDMDSYSNLYTKIEADDYDNDDIRHVDEIKRCLETLNEKEFKSAMIDLQGDYPNIICQKINNVLRCKIDKGKGIKLDNIKVNAELNDSNDFK